MTDLKRFYPYAPHLDPVAMDLSDVIVVETRYSMHTLDYRNEVALATSGPLAIRGCLVM